jgi:hypothetical protein
MEREVTVNNEEQKRLLVLNGVMAGRMTGEEAAELLERARPGLPP